MFLCSDRYQRAKFSPRNLQFAQNFEVAELHQNVPYRSLESAIKKVLLICCWYLQVRFFTFDYRVQTEKETATQTLKQILSTFFLDDVFKINRLWTGYPIKAMYTLSRIWVLSGGQGCHVWKCLEMLKMSGKSLEIAYLSEKVWKKRKKSGKILKIYSFQSSQTTSDSIFIGSSRL